LTSLHLIEVKGWADVTGTLLHLGTSSKKASNDSGIAGVSSVPKERGGMFVGNAWDPQDGSLDLHGPPA